MRPQVKALKAAAIQACHLKGFSFTEFMEDWGLEEILAEAEQDDTPAPELAARMLCLRRQVQQLPGRPARGAQVPQ